MQFPLLGILFFFFSFSIFLSPLIIPLSMLSNFFKNGTSPPQIFLAEYFDHFTLLIQFCSGPLKCEKMIETLKLYNCCEQVGKLELSSE